MVVVTGGAPVVCFTLVVTSAPLLEPVITVKSKTYIPENRIVNIPVWKSQSILVLTTLLLMLAIEPTSIILNSLLVAE